MSVCILANDDPQSRAMIAGIAKDHSISAIIFEKKPKGSMLKTLKFRIRRLGYKKVIGQLLLLVYEKMFLSKRSLSAIQDSLGSFGPIPTSIPTYTVKSVNSDRTLELLELHQPQICVITGTSIIKPVVLDKCSLFLNIHCGITPAYRGVHGGFWAIKEQDFKNVGVTIHKVDQGIDTGDIVYQEEVSFTKKFETHRTLAAKQYKIGIPLMSKAIDDGLNGRLPSFRRDDLESRQWFSPTLFDYFGFRKILSEIALN